MNVFTRSNLVLCGVLGALLLQSETATAQLAPHRNFGGRGGGYYGGYDTVIYPDVNKTNAAYQQAAIQAKQYQAQTASGRSSAWQGINQSLAQQANFRTQSMMAERDSAKDWWFQQQSQQLANRQARESYQPMNLPNSNYGDGEGNAPQQTPAAKEIMLWPTLLKDPAFAELRSEIESPFRIAYADNKPLSAGDYRGILKSIDAMKIKLKGISSSVVDSEYEAVVSYLDELSADAQKRLNARIDPKPETDKEKVPEAKK
jgi:hypothetical protein